MLRIHWGGVVGATKGLTIAGLIASSGGCGHDVTVFEPQPEATGQAGGSGDGTSGEEAGWSPRIAPTFDNPVMPGDHPDMNLFREGDDFYVTGSSFNMTPNVEILHSRDLVHWERLTRVVDPAWTGLQASQSGQGTWGGFIAKLGGEYFVYFAVSFNQYFAHSPSLTGPWSTPERVIGNTGYDNSVFVDDDGTTYMLMKANNCDAAFNTLRAIGPDGQLTGEVIDLTFVNDADGGCPDWAEGPTMAKRNGYYYYFVSTHTACGGREVVWRSSVLSSDPADWTHLGTVLVGTAPFGGSQHSTAPIELADGTWWALYHSYECGGWSGLGRHGLLGQVTWVDDVPRIDPTLRGASAPALESAGIPWLLPVNDTFEQSSLGPHWTFFGHTLPERYSLAERPGWLRLAPLPGQQQPLVQKAALHSNAMVTHVDFVPEAEGDAAGLIYSNPGNTVAATLARVWEGGDKIRFAFAATSATVDAPPGRDVWLKLIRDSHIMAAWFSSDRLSWTPVGSGVDLSSIETPNTINVGWVGTQAGVFASNRAADFDSFSYRDGFTALRASVPDHQLGTEVLASEGEGAVLGALEDQDWALYGSVDLGGDTLQAEAIELRVASAAPAASDALVEVWLDPLAGGSKVASCPIASTGSWDTWQTVTCTLTASGSHEVYLKVRGGPGELLRLSSLRFVPSSVVPSLAAPAVASER
jgi:xylan 1,4-beta-xylosidase